MQDLKYLSRSDIDDSLWNQAVKESPACVIYATTKWLDCNNPGWEALVWGNYKAVMPVTVKRKYGITYLGQPAFTQQLGIFYSTAISDEIRSSFISALKQKYRFAEICVNDIFKTFPGIIERKNYILNLNRPYSEIAGKYKESLKQVLKQVTLKGKLLFKKSQGTEQAIEYFEELNGSKINLTSSDYVKIKNAAKVFSPENAFVYEVYNNEDTLLSTALYFKFENRLYKITAATSIEGRAEKAHHFMIDQIIKEHAGRNFIFDFEGSSIPGVESFIKSFGAILEPYYFLKWNHLKWPLRLFKR